MDDFLQRDIDFCGSAFSVLHARFSSACAREEDEIAENKNIVSVSNVPEFKANLCKMNAPRVYSLTHFYPR